MNSYVHLFFIIIFFSIHQSIFAKEIKHEANIKSFEAAAKNSNQLKFSVESTKVGLFSSDVPGYVKSFVARANLNGKMISNMELILKSDSFDTDGDSRDEKLKELCLSSQKYPEIKIKLLKDYELGSGEVKIPAEVEIRGKKKNEEVEIEIKSNGDFLIVSVESEWSLKEMEIPDPSIAIAKLSDEIEIDVKLQLLIK